MRHHSPHSHLHGAFGNDGFAKIAESFARFFGTPFFLIAQTIIVVLWIVSNCIGLHFDPYPFILLNLAFSTQAAYAAPLILLAQTRQADRDKASEEADAKHREEIALIHSDNQQKLIEQNKLLLELMKQNTELTKRVETLTVEVHNVVGKKK